MKNETTLVIFGAPDHEEKLARKIAEAAGCLIATATCQGKPVHAGNAYEADGARKDTKFSTPPDEVIFFECGGHIEALTEGLWSPFKTAKCDHHNPGDPGYDCTPEYYWLGSALGQMCSALGLSKTTVISMLREVDDDLSLEGAWKLLNYTAAGDHCPAAAYAGNCTGIDPVQFMNFRLRQKIDSSMHPDEHEDQYTRLLYQIDRAVDLLEKHGANSTGILDLREYGEIEQLPEAALKTGRAYMSKIDELDRDRRPTGNKKIVLGGHTTPRQVVAFMGWARGLENRIGEPYGNPTRGFAGVVVSSS